MDHTGWPGGNTVRLRPVRSEEAKTLRGSEPQGFAAAYLGAESLERTFADEDTHVDRYRTLSLLGRGGMGEVVRSRDERIGREVALKSMIDVPPAARPEATARFLREARVQALLEHPAIVPVYEIGSDMRGLPFFTMKRVHGRTLFEILTRSPDDKTPAPNRNRLLRAFVTVCETLDYAHSRGVAHRDLKPDNIMLGRYGEVYVLDWGVAKLMKTDDEETGPESRATQPGEMVGTPGYMSPEQIVNIDNAVDERSDVFSLGCILFEIVAGRPLFDSPLTPEVLQQTLSPTRAFPVVAAAPPELMALAERATAYRPDDRGITARDLAKQVERFLDGDRDAALRMKLADGHASAARLASERAVQNAADSEALRSTALHEAGQALALCPEHVAARHVLLRLFATPPAAIPAAVRAEEARLMDGHVRDILRTSVWRFGAWIPLLGFLFLMGIQMPGLVTVTLSLVFGVFFGTLALLKLRAFGPGPRFGLFLAVLVLAGVLTFVFGPLVFVPGFVATTTMLYVAQSPRAHRPLSWALACSAVVVPLILELSGVVPPSTRIDTDAITLLPRMTNFSEGIALVALLAVSVLGIVTPAFLAGRMRDELLLAERNLLFQKWQLAQLLPRDTSPEKAFAPVPSA